MLTLRDIDSRLARIEVSLRRIEWKLDHYRNPRLSTISQFRPPSTVPRRKSAPTR